MRINKNKIAFLFLAIFLFVSFTLRANGADMYKNQELIPGSSTQTDCLPDYVKQIIGFGFAVIGILAMFMLCIGAYQYLMAAGNIGKVENAKNTIASALLGLVLGLTAYIILYKINPDLVSMKLDCSGSATGTPGGDGGGGGGGGGGGNQPPSPNAGKCTEGTGNCAESNMSCFGSRAKDASIICNAESGGGSAVESKTDLCGSDPASMGFMQINISCHNVGGIDCTKAFTCCYDPKNGCGRQKCQVKSREIYEQCKSAAKNVQTNMEVACRLFNERGFKPWGWTANKCGVNKNK